MARHPGMMPAELIRECRGSLAVRRACKCPVRRLVLGGRPEACSCSASHLVMALIRQPRARPLILIVERDDITATSHESIVLDAGFSVGASWSNYASAGKWLSAHSPDAAILDVRLQDKSCVELAKKLSEREIPFLAVSGYSAGTPGLNRIFRSVPWLEKPVTTAGLHLALRSIL